MLSEDVIERNVVGIEATLRSLLTSQEGTLHEPLVVNNLSWLGEMGFLQFLREVGKFARMGSMLSKDSVRTRCAMTASEACRILCAWWILFWLHIDNQNATQCWLMLCSQALLILFPLCVINLRLMKLYPTSVFAPHQCFTHNPRCVPGWRVSRA